MTPRVLAGDVGRCGGSVACAFNDRLKSAPGTANAFDVFPTQNPDETDNGLVFASVRLGLDGAACFARPHQKF